MDIKRKPLCLLAKKSMKVKKKQFDMKEIFFYTSENCTDVKNNDA